MLVLLQKYFLDISWIVLFALTFILYNLVLFQHVVYIKITLLTSINSFKTDYSFFSSASGKASTLKP